MFRFPFLIQSKVHVILIFACLQGLSRRKHPQSSGILWQRRVGEAVEYSLFPLKMSMILRTHRPLMRSVKPLFWRNYYLPDMMIIICCLGHFLASVSKLLFRCWDVKLIVETQIWILIETTERTEEGKKFYQTLSGPHSIRLVWITISIIRLDYMIYYCNYGRNHCNQGSNLPIYTSCLGVGLTTHSKFLKTTPLFLPISYSSKY